MNSLNFEMLPSDSVQSLTICLFVTKKYARLVEEPEITSLPTRNPVPAEFFLDNCEIVSILTMMGNTFGSRGISPDCANA